MSLRKKSYMQGYGSRDIDIRPPLAKTVKPIRPQDLKKKEPPYFVFEAVNELLQEKYCSERMIMITQNELMELVLKKAKLEIEWKGLTRETVFKSHWLDIEDHYREVGWTVVYDKPAYNEAYEAYFKFTSKPREA